MRVPIKRDLRYLEAAGTGGWLPLPRLGTSKPSESLKSNLYNSQSFEWYLDRVGAGWSDLARPSGVGLPGGGIGAWTLAGDRHPFPSPLRHRGAGTSPKFSPLFLGGVL